MNLIEKYALNSGVKIQKPQILEHFFPIDKEQYFCFSTNGKEGYDLWDLVLGLCRPFFAQHSITSVQIGETDDVPLNCDIDLRGRINLRQSTFLVKHAVGYCGYDNIFSHIAANHYVPTALLFQDKYGESTKPIAGENISLLPDPSLSCAKQINAIKPEVVAKNVALICGIEWEPSISTLFVGDRFVEKCIDIIPSQPTPCNSNKVNIRLDYCHEEKFLPQIVSQNLSEITTNKPFSLEGLNPKNISRVNYVAESFNKEFVEALKKRGIQTTLLCTSQENLSKERMSLIDYQVFHFDLLDKIQKNKEKLPKHDAPINIKSNKKILCGQQEFSNFSQYTGNLDDFFVDLEWFFCYIPSNV